MSPQTQQAALILKEKFGEIVLDTIPIYTPSKGEILIKVHAAALNPVDWKIQKNGMFIDDFPIILGTDIAGEVEEVGEGVTEFKKGDRVFGQGQFLSDKAGFQQYTLMLASTAARIPNNILYDEAATIPVALTIVYVALYNKAPYGFGFQPPVIPSAQGKYAGTPIVILGGSSAVGQIAIQFAKLSGFSPIITTASAKNRAALTSLGTDSVLPRDLSTTALAFEIAQLTTKPIKIVFDAISSAETQKSGVELLAPGGTLATVLPSTLKDADIKDGKTVFAALGLLRLPENVELMETAYHDNLEAWVANGVIKPNRVEVLPHGLRGIQDGLERMERNEVSMLKLVAHPQETAY